MSAVSPADELADLVATGDLSDQRVLITGAAGGIGRATALVAAQAGVGLVLVTANPMLSTNRSEVADVVAFLLSADARCVTGVAPPADAGVLATLGCPA